MPRAYMSRPRASVYAQSLCPNSEPLSRSTAYVYVVPPMRFTTASNTFMLRSAVWLKITEELCPRETEVRDRPSTVNNGETGAA